jgi:hypothetical protein
MDPATEIIQKVIAALRADTAVAAIVGTKVLDRPPHKDNDPSVTSPYISFGPHDTTTDELYDCLDLVDLNFQIDAWSWGGTGAYSRAIVSDIASAVRKALHRRNIVLASGSTAELLHRQTRFLRDPDGTNHAALTFESHVDVTQ